MKSQAAQLGGTRAHRWTMVVAVAAAAALIPSALGLVPVSKAAVSAPSLLRRVLASAGVSYSGLAESSAGLSLPDVEGAGRLAAMFGEQTRMRVWYEGPTLWRVDELTPIGERDLYRDPYGTWYWDSGRRHATRTEGEGTVRFARPADLLPPELGRRLAAPASPAELSLLPTERIAGIDAAGLRITPAGDGTTLDHADLWADPASGLVVRVAITARGMKEPIISSSFLDLEQRRPASSITSFELPEDADAHFSEAPDFARAVDRYSPYVLPETIAGATKRAGAGAAGTYGRRFSLIAVLVLPDRFFPEDRLSALPEVGGPWDSARLAASPLLNALTVVDGGAAYVLGGTVTPDRLVAVASKLLDQGVEVQR